ncbi:macro domain-containing protein [Paracoccus sp. ME4]|uniref:macro domain-containing protein n=1 Tax=Paracoccus sp. ME4 TaxID=3138066 RepID=UPI00398A5416
MLAFTPEQRIQVSDADFLVNTVNCVGVMGKGVALAIKTEFPQVMPPYLSACSRGYLEPGVFQTVKVNDRQSVINLATKDHWRDNSRYEWVGAGLVYLNRYFQDPARSGRSICMPLPGCGNGGLDPARVVQMIRTLMHKALEGGTELSLVSAETDPIADPVFYAGIGARKTPADVLALMREVGALAADAGLGLRSGGAIGADSAFQDGATDAGSGLQQIFLTKPRRGMAHGIVNLDPVFKRLARNFHPAPAAITPDPDDPDDRRHWMLNLMSRNGCQLFGADFTNPSNAVICWTEGGLIDGGTGQAIRMANSVGMPVINLGSPDLRGVRASDVLDLTIERIAEFRAARHLPEMAGSREATPVP